MENNKNILDKATEIISNDFMVKRHLYENTWVSGCVTEVAPITIWEEDGEIIIQLKTDRNVFKKTIRRIIEKSNGDIIYGYFRKSDGSCPSTLHFFVNYSWKGKMFAKHKNDTK